MHGALESRLAMLTLLAEVVVVTVAFNAEEMLAKSVATTQKSAHACLKANEMPSRATHKKTPRGLCRSSKSASEWPKSSAYYNPKHSQPTAPHEVHRAHKKTEVDRTDKVSMAPLTVKVVKGGRHPTLCPAEQ